MYDPFSPRPRLTTLLGAALCMGALAVRSYDVALGFGMLLAGLCLFLLGRAAD